MQPTSFSLFAVHISDGFLTWQWLVAGFLLAGLLAAGASLIDFCRAAFQGKELREEEIAYVAVLTAAFFLASQFNVRIGPASVHLLLNGLLGVVLRWRAALAIPVGLLLQAALFGHGGFTTLGVNSCVLVAPALFAWLLFSLLHRFPWRTSPWFRAILVGFCGFTCVLCLTYSIALMLSNQLFDLNRIEAATANAFTFHPVTLLFATITAAVLAKLEPRLENAPEFPMGLLIGIVTVLMTLLLNALVLVYGGEENWRTLALALFAAHMPIAVVEGFILGGIVGFLVRVKPSMLGWRELNSGKSHPIAAMPHTGLMAAECREQRISYASETEYGTKEKAPLPTAGERGRG